MKMREREEDGLIGAKTRDSAIKLFGRTIPFFTTASSTAAAMEVKDLCTDLTKPEQEQSSDLNGEGENLHRMAATVSNPEANLQNNEESSVDVKEDDQISKKLGKAVPCPRCNSYETKFCYFNNYNVNQPRHFCKHCHRYWTAGGTMRNVPVGAGKRRNNPVASPFCSSSDSANHPIISAVETSTSGVTFLKFRPERTLCSKSMDSAIDEHSATGSSTTTPTNVINEFSEMVDVGGGYYVKKKKKWCSENGHAEKMVEEDDSER